MDLRDSEKTITPYILRFRNNILFNFVFARSIMALGAS